MYAPINSLFECSQVAAEMQLDVASINAVRIAIGTKVVKSKCALSFQLGTTDPYLQFLFEYKDKMNEHCVYLRNEELLEVKYSISEHTAEGNEIADSMTVISFCINPTKKNKLNKYSKYYDPMGCDDKDTISLKRYISMEFLDAYDFKVRIG